MQTCMLFAHICCRDLSFNSLTGEVHGIQKAPKYTYSTKQSEIINVKRAEDLSMSIPQYNDQSMYHFDMSFQLFD